MTEYGYALEAMHTDKEWKIDPAEPLIWAPPFPEDKLPPIKHMVIQNFKRCRNEVADLAEITKMEFVHGPVRYFIETTYQLDKNDNIMYDENDEAIILDEVIHYDAWLYSFAWYVNTDEPMHAPTFSAIRDTPRLTAVTADSGNREVIRVPLDA